MRKRQSILAVAALALLLAALPATPAFALTTAASVAASNQANCDSIRQGAQAAQLKYISTFQPRQDPGQTFDDAVSSCLDSITNFQINIPTAWDAILGNIAKQLIQRTCQTARGQFNKAVSDATSAVNGTVNQVPGMSVSTSSSSGTSGNGVGVSATLQGDNGATVQSTGTSVVDRIFNVFK